MTDMTGILRRLWNGRRAVFLPAALFVLLLLPVNVFAEEPEKVRVGYYENEVFQEGAREGAVQTGYAYEYYRKLSEYTGWEYEYVFGSYSELYQALLDHKVDLLAGLAYRAEREAYLSYPEAPMGHESYNLLKHADDAEITSDPSTIQGRKIVVLDSAMVDVLKKYLEEQHVEAEILPLPEYDAVFKAFEDHEADLIAVEGNGTYGGNDADILCTFGYSDYYLCVNKERQDLLAELNSAQNQLSIDEPNYLNSLNERYYPHTLVSRAFSALEKEWLKAHSEIKVGYLENYLPYSGTDDSGEATGLVKDMVPRMLRLLGITNLKITYCGYESYDAMVADVDAGVVDTVFPVGGGLYFSEKNGIYQTNPVIYTTNELIFSEKFMDDPLSRFAVNENNRIHEYYVQTYFPDAEIIHCSSAEECLDAVLSGEATATLLNGFRASDMLKNRKYRGLSLQHLNRNDDRSFGVKIGNHGLLKLLNRGISVTGTDYAQSQVYRYTGQLYKESLLDYMLDHSAEFASVILLAALLLILLLVRDICRNRASMREKDQARQALEEKNEELENSRAALAEALEKAESASRAKTTFLNSMSHDMRTPMNAIVGFAALAAADPENTEKVQDYLGKISVSSERLLSLIDDVLDMSRIESGSVHLEETEARLPDMIRDLEVIVRPVAAEKGHTFTVEVKDLVHEDIVVDKLRLNRVLLNILSNAVKYTPDGGEIRLEVTESPSGKEGMADYEFLIRDNGIGMSPEFQKTVFDAFTRERTSTVSGITGTGLGMTITKNIVEMMDGTISVESEQGKGSVFTVHIPCKILPAGTVPAGKASAETALTGKKPAGTAAAGKGSAGTVSEGKKPAGTATAGKESAGTVSEGKESAGNVSGAAAGSASTGSSGKTPGAAAKKLDLPDFTGRRVLLAEDNEMNQLIAVQLLNGTGCAVEIANDGARAVEMMENAEAGRYDVILMDIQMPVMDGYEASRRIRALKDPEKATIPIIAVTANAFEEDRKTAMEAGMDGHLAKPYDIPKMMGMLSELFQKSGKRPG